jgi:hypothetical protein
VISLIFSNPCRGYSDAGLSLFFVIEEPVDSILEFVEVSRFKGDKTWDAKSPSLWMYNKTSASEGFWDSVRPVIICSGEAGVSDNDFDTGVEIVEFFSPVALEDSEAITVGLPEEVEEFSPEGIFGMIICAPHEAHIDL